MSLLSCCGSCNDPAPRWTITRAGDVARSWACDTHLAAECESLQRDSEVTELSVVYRPKAVEWAALSRSLEEIARGSA